MLRVDPLLPATEKSLLSSLLNVVRHLNGVGDRARHPNDLKLTCNSIMMARVTTTAGFSPYAHHYSHQLADTRVWRCS